MRTGPSDHHLIASVIVWSNFNSRPHLVVSQYHPFCTVELINEPYRTRKSLNGCQRVYYTSPPTIHLGSGSNTHIAFCREDDDWWRYTTEAINSWWTSPRINCMQCAVNTEYTLVQSICVLPGLSRHKTLTQDGGLHNGTLSCWCMQRREVTHSLYGNCAH